MVTGPRSSTMARKRSKSARTWAGRPRKTSASVCRAQEWFMFRVTKPWPHFGHCQSAPSRAGAALPEGGGSPRRCATVSAMRRARATAESALSTDRTSSRRLAGERGHPDLSADGVAREGAADAGGHAHVGVEAVLLDVGAKGHAGHRGSARA